MLIAKLYIKLHLAHDFVINKLHVSRDHPPCSYYFYVINNESLLAILK